MIDRRNLGIVDAADHLERRDLDNSIERAALALGDTLRSISDFINDSIREISDVLLGPQAPPRKRPRRVAKRIAARHGRLRFSRFNAGCKV